MVQIYAFFVIVVLKYAYFAILMCENCVFRRFFYLIFPVLMSFYQYVGKNRRFGKWGYLYTIRLKIA